MPCLGSQNCRLLPVPSGVAMQPGSIVRTRGTHHSATLAVRGTAFPRAQHRAWLCWAAWRALSRRMSSGKSPSHIDGPLGVSPRSQKASVLERLNGMSLSTLGNLVCGIATPVDRGREAVEASTVGEWACRTGSGCHKIGRRQCKRAEGDAWPMHWGAGGGGGGGLPVPLHALKTFPWR
jgi:hypothetical protein